MAKKVRELMSEQPIKLSSSAPVIEAARRMRAANVGAIVVEDNGRLAGIATDRDIAIRAVADGRDPQTTPLSEICSKELTALSPDDDIDRAIQVMREKAIRRLLVVTRNSRADGNVSGRQPACLISNSSDSRTDTSSSTTKTVAVTSGMVTTSVPRTGIKGRPL